MKQHQADVAAEAAQSRDENHRRPVFVDLARELARRLGGDWQMTGSAAPYDDFSDDRRAYVTSQSRNLKLWVGPSWPRGRTRIGASPLKGEFPRGWNAAKGMHTVLVTTEITLSLTRPIEQVQREVERRLLAGCVPAARAALTQAQVDDEEQAKREATAAELSRLVGNVVGAEAGRHRDFRVYGHAGKGNGRVDVELEVRSENDVKMTLRSLSAAQARAVIACLAGGAS